MLNIKSRKKETPTVLDPLDLDDAIVLLIGARGSYAGNQPIVGITKLEKLLFLAGSESNKSGWMDLGSDFEPSQLGPFSSRFYQNLNALISVGLVDETINISNNDLDTWESREIIGLDSDPFLTRKFSLSPLGNRYLSLLSDQIGSNAPSEISSFKNSFAHLPTRQIIRYIYNSYPEYTVLAK